MTNFVKITSNAKYPTHVLRRSALSMLIRARSLQVENPDAYAILWKAAIELAGR